MSAFRKNSIFFIFCIFLVLFLYGLTHLMFAPRNEIKKEQIIIGFSIDDLRVERWQKDKKFFEEAAIKAGAKVITTSANANQQTQIAQIENLISKSVDVLVIVPFNAKGLSNVIKLAKKQGIKVVAYDRLIMNSDVDLYVSFDNYKIGKIQVKEIAKIAPKGNYFFIEGSPADSNAFVYHQGHMDEVKKHPNIKLLGYQYSDEWLATKAINTSEVVLSKYNNDITAFIAANDTLAGGVAQSVKAQGLSGKILITGMDADLEAARRILKGEQTMTVYKSIPLLASTVAEYAVKLAKNESFKIKTVMKNDYKDVPSILLDSKVITKDNLDLLIKEGMYTKKQIYSK